MSSVSTAVPHQATVTFTGRPVFTRNYDANMTSTVGWTVVGGGSMAAILNEYVVTITGASGTYLSRARTASAAGQWLRARFYVRLANPEDRPTQMYVSDPSGQGFPPWEYGGVGLAPDWARVVSGDEVVVEGWVPATTTSVRLNVVKPTGATDVDLLISAVEFDVFSETGYNACVWREDSNGTARALDFRDPGSDPVAGVLTLVDREASLNGPVTWRLREGTLETGSVVESLTATLTSSGYAIVHRVHDPTSTMHEVVLLSFGAGRASRTQPIEVVDEPLPVVILGPLSARAAAAGFRFDEFDDAHDFLDDLALGEVFMLRQPVESRQRLDGYFVATAVDLSLANSDDPDGPWDVAGTVVETARGVA